MVAATVWQNRPASIMPWLVVVAHMAARLDAQERHLKSAMICRIVNDDWSAVSSRKNTTSVGLKLEDLGTMYSPGFSKPHFGIELLIKQLGQASC